MLSFVRTSPILGCGLDLEVDETWGLLQLLRVAPEPKEKRLLMTFEMLCERGQETARRGAAPYTLMLGALW